ncbi:hypothetical protein C7212DRAFT_329695 [Tuber magnatum]|uniref:Hydrophobic surface binding protein A n=1 Tax=Tuber magnatum TaxID=42249 RepID=A0A317SK65_9PEZI|nr:hypothetical protein C7212DRAFT_329695 [Tuber magnatum]
MYFPNLLLFLFLSAPFTTSLTLPTTALKSRDYTPTITKVDTIINDLSALETAVIAFTGDPTDAQSIGVAAGNVDNDLRLATADIATSTYSASESAALRALVVPLGPRHTSGLAMLSAKAPMFAALGLTAHVSDQLLQLSIDNDNFWTVLVGKLAAGDQDAVEAAGDQTRVAYQDALAEF